LKQTSPMEAYEKLDDLGAQCIDDLRKLGKQLQEARQEAREEDIQHYVEEYDALIERYIPILMAQAKIFWDKKDYQMVEKVFRKSVEFCGDHDVWRLNVAHVLFMQEKYKETISFYEPLVQKNGDQVREE
jgi:tetratricopeptide repeat protein 30